MLDAGTYYVTVIVNGCSSLTDSVIVIVTGGGGITISGNCHNMISDSIRTVTLRLTGTTVDSTISAINGNYLLPTVQSGGNYTVTPTKNNDVMRTNGVTTLDVALIKRHTLGISILNSPYKILAADVNNSNSVTALDAALTQRFILGIDSMFNGQRLWKFVPDNYTFISPTNPWTPSPPPVTRTYTNITVSQTAQDFVGMKLGDVNNSWSYMVAKTATTGTLFAGPAEPIVEADEVTVPIRTNDFHSIAGYQFTVGWNAAELEFLEVHTPSLPAQFGEWNVKQGMLTVSWSDNSGGVQTLADGTALFDLKFHKIKSNATTESVSLNSDFTSAEAYNENLDILNIRPYASGNTIKSDLAIYPNPSTGQFHLSMTGKDIINADIRIISVDGKTMIQFHRDSLSGILETDFDLGTLADGLYLVEVNTGTEIRMKKIIKQQP